MKSALCLTLFFFQSLSALQVQGHRGARALMPENTIPSFACAIESGAHALEMDLLLTSDGECIIHHNFFVNKEICTYFDGSLIEETSLISKVTLSQIEQIDAGGRVNSKFPKQVFLPKTPIPTLQSLISWIENSSHPNAKTIRLNLEIKRDPRFPEWTETPEVLAEKIVNIVEQNGFADRVYYSSFDPEVLFAIRKKSPTAILGFIFEEETLQFAHPSDSKKALDLILQMASSMNASVLSPDHELLDGVVDVGLLKEKGFQVIPWTVNDPIRWKELINLGVDGIITDDPKALTQWLGAF